MTFDTSVVQTGRPSHSMEHSTTTELKEIRWAGVERVHLEQDRGGVGGAFCGKRGEKTFRVTQNPAAFSTSLKPILCPQVGYLPHEVSIF